MSKVIGLLSSGNLEIVNTLGTYDVGVTYNSIADIGAGVPTVIVDMSDNRDVLRALNVGALYVHLGENMKCASTLASRIGVNWARATRSFVIELKSFSLPVISSIE